MSDTNCKVCLFFLEFGSTCYENPYLQIFVVLLICTGIKINNLGVLESQGYSRSLIASRAIEAYLIQVNSYYLLPTLAVFFLNPVACSLDRIYWSNALDLGEPFLNIQYFLWKFTMAKFSCLG
jgi:hypothetical protein